MHIHICSRVNCRLQVSIPCLRVPSAPEMIHRVSKPENNYVRRCFIVQQNGCFFCIIAKFNAK